MQQMLGQLQQENQALKADKTIDFKKLEIEAYNAETKRIAALNQDKGTEGPDDLEALKLVLDQAKTIDEHDIQRGQLEHSIVMDHMQHNLEQQKIDVQQQQIDNQHELAQKQLTAQASQKAQSASSKK